MSNVFRIAPLLAVLAVAGCGGLGDQCAGGNVECRNRTFGLSPDQAAVQPGGTVLLTATSVSTVDSITFSVEGGDAHGTLGSADGAANPSTTTYTAPEATGTYRVVARFAKGSRTLSTQTATILVAVVP